MVVPNKSQTESDENSEIEGEKPVAKTEFTEGILWRPTESMPNSTVKNKPGPKRSARK